MSTVPAKRAATDPEWPTLRDRALPPILVEGEPVSDALLTEYRRFLRLAQMFEGQVTPPASLEAVWQAHDPRDGLPSHDLQSGRGDVPHFAGRYQITRRAYARYFGQEPPSEIWPDPPAPMADRPGRSFLAGAILCGLIAVLLPADRMLLRLGMGAIAVGLVWLSLRPVLKRWRGDAPAGPR